MQILKLLYTAWQKRTLFYNQSFKQMHTSPNLDNKDKHSEISQERGIFTRMQRSDIIKDYTGHT